MSDIDDDHKYHISRRINIVNVVWFATLAASGFWFLHTVTTDIALLTQAQEEIEKRSSERFKSLSERMESYELIHYKLDKLLGN